ncbi:MAG: hypothetical protein RML72_12555 [Bacteroidia bacterium]|nr:hypothetical protein [Bacteroidia bacterium]MDW8159690.1 hypothetical protein [Bacteroidia bacterium]
MECSIIQIEQNVCTFKVPHTVAQYHILEHKENLLEYLRQKCANPTLNIQIQIDESLIQNPPNTTALTHEERRKLMEQANPHLLLLEQKFNTILGY